MRAHACAERHTWPFFRSVSPNKWCDGPLCTQSERLYLKPEVTLTIAHTRKVKEGSTCFSVTLLRLFMWFVNYVQGALAT